MSFSIALVVAFLIYLLIGPWLIFRGHILVGGIVMVIASIAPVFAQVWLTDSDMPGPALFTLVLIPIPALIVLSRVLFLIVRALHRAMTSQGRIA